MIAHVETWEVGRKIFVVTVEENQGNFSAKCSRISGLVTTGQTIKDALDRYMFFSEPFFDHFIINLPVQERRQVCLWMDAPEVQYSSRTRVSHKGEELEK